MLTIRPAAPEDSREILEVHFAAVHGQPQQYYDEAILEDWSPVVDEARIANYLSRPQIDEEMVRVAVLDDNVVAFAVLVPAQNLLRACYVHPRVCRQGIGLRLLSELEKEGAAQGLAWINLNASLNAEPFYLAAGYVADGMGRQPLPGGNEMSCVRMYKFLPAEGWRPPL